MRTFWFALGFITCAALTYGFLALYKKLTGKAF
jgi:hypothetical protein